MAPEELGELAPDVRAAWDREAKAAAEGLAAVERARVEGMERMADFRTKVLATLPANLAESVSKRRRGATQAILVGEPPVVEARNDLVRKDGALSPEEAKDKPAEEAAKEDADMEKKDDLPDDYEEEDEGNENPEDHDDGEQTPEAKAAAAAARRDEIVATAREVARTLAPSQSVGTGADPRQCG